MSGCYAAQVKRFEELAREGDACYVAMTAKGIFFCKDCYAKDVCKRRAK